MAPRPGTGLKVPYRHLHRPGDCAIVTTVVCNGKKGDSLAALKSMLTSQDKRNDSKLEDFLRIIALTGVAGLAMPLGAALSAIGLFKRGWLATELRHLIMAFGGGALLSAVALVLVPEGAETLSIAQTAFWFTAGGLSFMALDIALERLHSPMAQLAAMLSDFIPEALALGAALAAGNNIATLIAALMALQNLPEGFNSALELKENIGISHALATGLFLVLALFGPVCGVVGFYLLADAVVAVSSIMLFAAGGILYITFGDIAPQAKLDRHWFPALGAVAGFLLGLIGHQLAGMN